jgi:hypothetical protein
VLFIFPSFDFVWQDLNLVCGCWCSVGLVSIFIFCGRSGRPLPSVTDLSVRLFSGVICFPVQCSLLPLKVFTSVPVRRSGFFFVQPAVPMRRFPLPLGCSWFCVSYRFSVSMH